MKCKLATLLLSLAFFPALAHADDASRHAKAEKLIEVMHLDSMMDQTFAAIKAQMPALIGSNGDAAQMNPRQKQLTDEFQDKLIAIMHEEMRTKIMPAMADTYAKTFTDEELDGMLTFYASPVGQSVVRKMPEAMQNSMSSMQGMMTDVMPKIQALGEEYAPKFKAAARQPTS